MLRILVVTVRVESFEISGNLFWVDQVFLADTDTRKSRFRLVMQSLVILPAIVISKNQAFAISKEQRLNIGLRTDFDFVGGDQIDQMKLPLPRVLGGGGLKEGRRRSDEGGEADKGEGFLAHTASVRLLLAFIIRFRR